MKRLSLGFLLVCFLCGSTFAAQTQGTPAELQAEKEAIFEKMKAEGLAPENCYLKGRTIGSINNKPKPLSYPEGCFPYKWNFDDGSVGGINEVSQDIAEMRVEKGVLLFTTIGDNAYFSWGNFDKSQPGLLWGYNKYARQYLPLTHIRMKVRQSLPESIWQVSVKSLSAPNTAWVSADFTVKGSDWQTIEIPIKITESKGNPPYTGLRILSRTPGNKVEIDFVEPLSERGIPCYRKVIEVPAKVRWAKCSVVSGWGYYGGSFVVYINGVEAVKSPEVITGNQIWNYDLPPELFQSGKNVIGVSISQQNGGGFLFTLDGALLCEDGSYVRFDSDTSWKGSQFQDNLDWTKPDYDDRKWDKCVEAKNIMSGAPQPEEYCAKFWFNPSWKGRIMVEPGDGRGQPVYGRKEEISLKISVPRREGKKYEVTYQVYDEMGDYYHAEDKLVKTGELPLNIKGKDEVGILRFAPGELPYNAAYAVVLHFQEDGKEVEKYRYEIAVCGPVEQPVVKNPKSYTDGMELKLVWEIDAAEEPKEGEFVSCDGWAKPRESTVIITPLGRFRQTYNVENLGSLGGGRCNYISWKYYIQHPGRPHIAIADFPDDTVRIQEMRLTESLRPDIYYTDPMVTELGNDTVVLGYENPLTYQMRQHHVLFFPSQKVGAISFLSLSGKYWKPEMAVRIGKIKIYEILNDVPVREIIDAPGPAKWIGQDPEPGPRVAMQICLTSPIKPLIFHWLSVGETPNFYRHWMISTINQIKRMKFAGENAYFSGQYMYDAVLYPSIYSDKTNFARPQTGISRDYGVLMAKMFEENNLGLFSGLEMWGLSHVYAQCSDDDVARGMDTLSQVDKNGKQQYVFSGPVVVPNWIRPEVRKHFETVINELIDLYGNENGWKGIELQVNEVLGPGWVTLNDPYFCSYDDYTISLFEEETGIKIPVDKKDTNRFSLRYTWLQINAKKEWTDWRCKKMNEIYQWLTETLKKKRSDLMLIFYPQGMSYILPRIDEKPEEKLPTMYDYSRRGGLDPEFLMKNPDIIFCMNVQCTGDMLGFYTGTPNKGIYRHWSRNDDFLGVFANDGKNGVAVRYNWFEAQPEGPDGWIWNFSTPESWLYTMDDYFADYWTNAFIRTNPVLILGPLQDQIMWNGRETSMSRFAQSFRSVPVGKYTRLHGNGRDINVWIEVTQYGEDVYGYLANPQWWEIEAKVEFAPKLKIYDLIENKIISGNMWNVHCAPYTVYPFKVERAKAEEVVLSCASLVSDKIQKKEASNVVKEAEKLLTEH